MVKNYGIEQKDERLSDNFRVNEFWCKCGSCEKAEIDERLVSYLQRIRNHFGKPLEISSGYRCPAHNAAVGGVKGSRHVSGKAADFIVRDVSPGEIAKYAETIGLNGIGLYDDFVHIDIRENRSFWFGHEQAYRSTFGGGLEETFDVELRYLRRGCRGEDVRSLQVLLCGCGYQIDRDGVFGPATERAVKQYQKNVELATDGVVGPATRKRMLGV